MKQQGERKNLMMYAGGLRDLSMDHHLINK